VRVNAEVATIGQRVEPSDRILVDGRPVKRGSAAARRVLLYHKPVGEVCTRSDPEGRPTVFEHLPRLGQGRWVAVGRLDLNTSGLLLFTTDGELANRLMHPSNRIEREYAVRVVGPVDVASLERLRQGVELEDGPARFESIREGGGEGLNRWFHVTLCEGRQREVRRLWEAVGHTVSRLARVRFGRLSLPRGLRPGRWRELASDEVDDLARSVGLATETLVVPKAGRRGSPKKTATPSRGRRVVRRSKRS
jgi:23S rRNA pseudouridine2605 synthase